MAACSAACLLLDPFPSLSTLPSEADAEADDGSALPSDPDADRFDGALASGCDAGATVSCGFEQCTGVRRCAADGTWSECDARRPSVELCATTADESCDGEGRCTGAYGWVRAFGDGLAQTASSVAVDDEGNVYVVGAYAGALAGGTPDGGALAHGLDPGKDDAFVLKLDAKGKVQWSVSVHDARFTAVAATADGIVVGGGITATTTLAGCGVIPFTGGFTGDIVLARFDRAGSCVTARSFGNGGSQSLVGVAVDTKGDVHAVGMFTGEISFRAADAGLGLADAGTEAFWVRTDPALVARASHRIAVDGRVLVRGVAVDAKQRAAVVGAFAGWLGLETSRGSQDAFIVTLDAQGTRLGVARFGEEGQTDPAAVTFDGAGRLVVVGGFQKAIDLSAKGGPVLTVPQGSGADLFVVRSQLPVTVGSPLQLGLQAKSYGGAVTEVPRDVAVDGAGNIVIVGEVVGGAAGATASLGGAPHEPRGRDAFVAKLGSSLEPVWSAFFGSDAELQRAAAVATDALGRVYVAGPFAGSASFGDGGATFTAAGPGVTNTDAVVFRLAP